MGWVLDSGDSDRVGVNDSGGSNWIGSDVSRDRSGPALEEAFHTFEDLRGRARRMYNPTKLAAVSHAMSKPACELLHFAYTIGQVRSINLFVVAGK